MEYKQRDIHERAMELTGHTTNLHEAFDQWERERSALAELYQENQTLSVRNRKLVILIAIAEKVINAMHKDAALFVKPPTHKLLHEFREAQKTTIRDETPAWTREPAAKSVRSRTAASPNDPQESTANS